MHRALVRSHRDVTPTPHNAAMSTLSTDGSVKKHLRSRLDVKMRKEMTRAAMHALTHGTGTILKVRVRWVGIVRVKLYTSGVQGQTAFGRNAKSGPRPRLILSAQARKNNRGTVQNRHCASV